MNRFIFAIAFALAAVFVPLPSLAQEAVIAIVNDHPITSFDIDQRIKLMGLLGSNDPARLARKVVLNNLIDDFVKIDEAKLLKIDPTTKDLDERLNNIAQALKTDRAGLGGKLTSLGLSEASVVQYSAAQMSFSRLLLVKYHVKLTVSPADVDKKLTEVKAELQGRAAQMEKDPRRQPVQVLQLQEINFPVDGTDPGLFQSRAVEAGQVAQKVKSCAGFKEASAGIFNVQLGKKIEADARKLPPKMLEIIKQHGVGHAVGPMRYTGGLQLLVFCGSRTVTPPPVSVTMPTREQIESVALNDRYTEAEKQYTAQMRKEAVIEYKDPSYAQ
jgi:peptidyl-prolyl cis-trans isomerase SurA